METFFPRGYITKEKEVFPIPKEREGEEKNISFQVTKILEQAYFLCTYFDDRKRQKKFS
ncbi:hypothetical protein BREVNS_1025 [Brevinematales bacterium NS]|nr:hypothetical protein BREVNS_1025 [Brevinematales bacterium NS]